MCHLLLDHFRHTLQTGPWSLLLHLLLLLRRLLLLLAVLLLLQLQLPLHLLLLHDHVTHAAASCCAKGHCNQQQVPV
jgi:hypothetical protein